MKIFDFFRKYMGKMVGAGAEIFDKLEPEPHKNGPAPQHCLGEYERNKELIYSYAQGTKKQLYYKQRQSRNDL
jgi:hypothetical protein